MQYRLKNPIAQAVSVGDLFKCVGKANPDESLPVPPDWVVPHLSTRKVLIATNGETSVVSVRDDSSTFVKSYKESHNPADMLVLGPFGHVFLMAREDFDLTYEKDVP